MIQHLTDILVAAGVVPLPTTTSTSTTATTTTPPPPPLSDEQIISIMERWIGVPVVQPQDVEPEKDDVTTTHQDDNEFTTTMGEDCCCEEHLSDEVIDATKKWLISAWNDDDDDDGGGSDYNSINNRMDTTSRSTKTTSTRLTQLLLQQVISNTTTAPDSDASSLSASAQATTRRPNTNNKLQPPPPPLPLLLLEQVVNSIRATKYLRAWMELSCTGVVNDNNNNNNNNSNTKDDLIPDSLVSSLSHRLLLPIDDTTLGMMSSSQLPLPLPSSSSSSVGVANSSFVLLDALFHHIQNLPVLQHQILAFTTTRQQHHQQQQQQRSSSSTIAVGDNGSRNGTPTAATKHDTDTDDPHTMVSSLSTQEVTDRIRQYEHVQFIAQSIQNEFQHHLYHLEYILGDLYAAASSSRTTPYRCYIRQQLGQLWTNFVRNESSLVYMGGGGYASTNTSMKQENTKAVAIRLTLNVLRRILLGMSSSSSSSPLSPISEVRNHLLFHQLIPLHEVNGVVLWRDQVSILELYHEPLCQCMAILIQQELHRTSNENNEGINTTIILKVIQQLLLQPNIFPTVGSTSKQVLLLHEIDTYIRLVPSSRPDKNLYKTYYEEEKAMLQVLFKVLARCMSSEHSRVAERALQFFQSSMMDVFLMRPTSNDDDDDNDETPQPPTIARNNDNVVMCLRILLPSLIRTEPSWNPTVRKMTYHVIKKLQSYDDGFFVTICNELFAHHHMRVSETSPNIPTTSKLLAERGSTYDADTTPKFSLKAGMGNWRPPTSSIPSNLNNIGIPGRGMAPWTTSNSGQQHQLPSTMKPQRPVGTSGKFIAPPPPLTITGVAPWAMQQSKQTSTVLIRNSSTLTSHHLLPSIDGSSPESTTPISSKSGFDHVLAYIERIKPPIEEEGVSSWSRIQMAETPTLLPNLKFHDLVFGHDLGTGAFGSVKYARMIDKAKSRSYWPEYAVKVVSTRKIYEMGYEMSIQREIAVLHILSHPGIARLISSFRFNDGAYLVLEYASCGDLHSLLVKHGSLNIESTRFVIGEIVATLSSIHDLGFVYGDLKPENIVITEPGHIKLTDFGGCRPITTKAKRLVATIKKDMLKNLRNGDWKDKTPSILDDVNKIDQKTDSDDGAVRDDEWVEDIRIEGTTAYLPPEVVMGGYPTFATDAWALGCVTYQCLTGRPPLLDVSDGATRNRIVTFDIDIGQERSDIDQLFDEKHAAGINVEASDMIKKLLDRDPLMRPSMNQLAENNFFTTDVFILHSQPAYPLDVGTVGPTPNAQWARRQFSSIWAPQPEAYNTYIPISSSVSNTQARPLPERPIAEGEESTGFFSATGKLSHAESSFTAGKRTKKIMLPPSYE